MKMIKGVIHKNFVTIPSSFRLSFHWHARFYLDVAVNEEKWYCGKKSLTMHVTRGTSVRLNPTVCLRRQEVYFI